MLLDGVQLSRDNDLVGKSLYVSVTVILHSGEACPEGRGPVPPHGPVCGGTTSLKEGAQNEGGVRSDGKGADEGGDPV